MKKIYKWLIFNEFYDNKQPTYSYHENQNQGYRNYTDPSPLYSQVYLFYLYSFDYPSELLVFFTNIL